MAEREEQRSTTVPGLKNFPFRTFDELKKAAKDGSATISVHAGVPLQWVRVEGPCSGSNARLSPSQKGQIMGLALLPFIAGLGFITYIVTTGRWPLLLSLPLLFIGYSIFYSDPAKLTFHEADSIRRAQTMSLMRRGFLASALIALAWGFISETEWITALALTLTVICFAQRSVDHKSVKWLIHAAWEQEELPCLLWSAGALNVRLSNGNIYLVDCRKENGQFIYYKTTLNDGVFQQKGPLQNILLAKITPEELESGNVSDARLADIKVNSGLWSIRLDQRGAK